MSADQRKEQIAEEALRILALEGPTRLTARRIATGVGVTDAAIFRHFADKPAIVDAAIARFEATFEMPAPPEGAAPLERLRHFMVERIGRIRRNPEVMSLTLNERLSEVAGEEGAARVQRVVRRSMATVRRCVRAAQEEGSLNPEASPDVLLWMIQGVIRGAVRAGPRRHQTPEAVFDDLLLALGASPPTGEPE